MRRLRTRTPAETEAAGAALAATLRPGDVVLLRGDLGAGKTTFVRGAARALGVTDPVTSPTFSIGHRYVGAGGLVVSHLDLYRVADPETEDPGLLADYLGDGRIAFVEWPPGDAVERLGARHEVRLSHAGGDERELELEDLAA